MLYDFATLAPQDRHTLLVSTVVPRPIAWVVSQDLDGGLNAAPYSFFNVFADDPALVILGIGGRNTGRTKDTDRNIRQTGEFVINLVGHDNLSQMNVTAIDFAPDVDELAEAGLSTLPSTHVKPPRIAESPVALECRRFMVLDLSVNRTLVLGEVLAMHVRDDCLGDAGGVHLDTTKLDLVGRLHGTDSYVRTTDRHHLPRIDVADWQRRT